MGGRRSSSVGAYDWETVKNDYVSSSITLDGISEKYGIPRATVGYRSSRDGWKKARGEVSSGKKSGVKGEKTYDGAGCVCVSEQKKCEGYSAGEERLERLREISDVITQKISDAVNDERQFNRYLVSEKVSDENGKPVTVTDEKCFEKLDVKSLKEVTSTLKVLTECVKGLYDIYPSDTADAGEDEVLTVRFIDGGEYAE